MGRQRADTILVQQQLVESSERARAEIMAGKVRVGGQLVAHPSSLLDPESELKIDSSRRYVSRGGYKLEGVLEALDFQVGNLVALDVGSSTGGFTDCLLQQGVAIVYAIDVGYGQLAYRLRNDSRVVSMERTNICKLSGLPQVPDIATIDVSFTSLKVVIPVVKSLLRVDAPIIALLKPQFEARRNEVESGGVIRSPQLHATVIGRFAAWAVEHGYRLRGPIASSVPGSDGNLEFFMLLRPSNCQGVG